jgi:hypothetical protein
MGFGEIMVTNHNNIGRIVIKSDNPLYAPLDKIITEASNHPPAEPGAFKIVSRSKRLSWVADATALSLGPPKGGLLAPEV